MNISLDYLLELAVLWLFRMLVQAKSLLPTLRKLWWGGLFVIVYILLEQVFEAPALLVWNAEAMTYRNGILFLLMLAWVLLLWSHVLKRESHVVSHGNVVEQPYPGNANMVSVGFALIATLFFLVIGTSTLTLIILGSMQVIPFFLGESYQEQAEYELPRLINLVFVALAFWILVFD